MPLGGLRLSAMVVGMRSAARSAISIVRHGVTSGVRPRTTYLAKLVPPGKRHDEPA